MARSASFSIVVERSTSLPSTFAASAARARPAPIDCATSAAVTGPEKDFCEPSGRRMLGIRHESLYAITMKLPLTLAINPYDHARDLRAEGIDLTVLELPIEEIFFRFTKFREWDASEMSFGKTVSLMAQAAPEIMPIPVFPSRVFRHSAIYVGEKSPIRQPQDLEGRKVGIPGMGADCRHLRARPAAARVRRRPCADPVVPGRRAAARARREGEAPPARRGAHHGGPGQEPCRDAGRRRARRGDLGAQSRRQGGCSKTTFPWRKGIFGKPGIYPIMHVVVLRRDSYERDRWVAMNLFKAFEAAKRESMQRLVEIGLSHVPMPWLAEHARRWRELAGEDFWPYGLEPNRPTLEAFVQYSHEQGITSAG
jgi:4,5-dihydroxyphthalate decarboxylase